MLPKLGGGLYGIDVDPWHVKSYLLYSLKRLGLEYIDAATLRKASAIHPIHTVELEYSLADRDIEKEMIGTTGAEHLSESVDALKTELTAEEMLIGNCLINGKL